MIHSKSHRGKKRGARRLKKARKLGAYAFKAAGKMKRWFLKAESDKWAGQNKQYTILGGEAQKQGNVTR